MSRKSSNINFYKNNRFYLKWWDKLKKISVSRFKWNNLPDTIDERFLEMGLFNFGFMCFFHDEIIGHLALKCTMEGMLDVYDVPTLRRAYANNGYQRLLNSSNSVIIFNNYVRTSGVEIIEPYAYELYETNATQIVNMKAQKTPILLVGPEGQRLTLKNMYMQFDGNAPVIYGTDALQINDFKVLKTDAPFIVDKLQYVKSEIWNEALTALGIPNVSTTKQTTILNDQVERMQGGAFSSRYSDLEMRRQACEQINRMFGLNISVEFRLDTEVSLYPDKQTPAKSNENIIVNDNLEE